MKRFVASELWDKAWFRKLPPRLKCLWFYMIQRCDCAGVWEGDLALASFHIGSKVSEADLTIFGNRLEKLPSGKIWLNTFLIYQYVTLSHGCPAHKPVFESIERNKLEDRLTLSLYDRLMDRGQEKEKDKEKDKDKDKDKDKNKENSKQTSKRESRPSSIQVVIDYMKELNIANPEINANKWMAHYEKVGWKSGRSTIVDWKAAVRTWDLPKTAEATPKEKSIYDKAD